MATILNPPKEASAEHKELAEWLTKNDEEGWAQEIVFLNVSDAKMLVNGIRHNTETSRFTDRELLFSVIHDIHGIAENKRHFSPRFERYRNDPKGGE